MELQHLIIKIPLEGEPGMDPASIVNLFHQWVAGQSVPGVLLIDVAELLHVPNGPGVVAVGVEADYAFDNTGGSWGALYRRKAMLHGSNRRRIAQAVASAARTALLLEEAFPGALQFSRARLDIIVNDRGLAPNTEETRAAAWPEMQAGLRAALGHDNFKLTLQEGDRRQRVGATLVSERPFDLAVLAAAETPALAAAAGA